MQVNFSKLNHIRFVPTDRQINELSSYRDYDTTWFKEYIRTWETKHNYFNPVQNNDSLNIHVTNTENYNATKLRLYNCSGLELGDWNFQHNVNIPTPAPPFGYDTFSSNDFWENYDEGTYYLTVEIGYDANNTNTANAFRVFISEPIHLKHRHENTLLIGYTNSYNKDNVMFEQTQMFFSLRVYGAILSLLPQVNRTIFQDQDFNAYNLKSTAYRQWALSIGGNAQPIPDYLIETLNHSFACDNLLIDGKRYTVPEEGGFEKTEYNNTPLYNISITIQDADLNNVGQVEFPNVYTFIPVLPSSSNPYHIFTLNAYTSSTGFNFKTLTSTIENYIINGLTQLQDYVTLLNSNLPPQLNGQFALYNSNTTLVYEYGQGDLPFLGHNTYILNAGYIIEIEDTVSIPVWAGIEIRVNNNFNQPVVVSKIISTASNTYEVQDITSLPSNPSVSKGFEQAISVNPNTTSKFLILMPYGTFVLYFRSAPSLFYGNRLKSLSSFGIYYDLLDNIEIHNTPALTSFDILNVFSDYFSGAELQALTQIKVINNPNLTDLGSLKPSVGWSGLSHLEISNNAFDDTYVDALLNDMYDLAINSVNGVQNGVTFIIDNQTPPAPPTAASAFALNYLQTTKGWSITTD